MSEGATMPIPLSVALFGGLGALSRYGVDLLIERHTATYFRSAPLPSTCPAASLRVRPSAGSSTTSMNRRG
jgi:hypothetical protein